MTGLARAAALLAGPALAAAGLAFELEHTRRRLEVLELEANATNRRAAGDRRLVDELDGAVLNIGTDVDELVALAVPLRAAALEPLLTRRPAARARRAILLADPIIPWGKRGRA